MASRQKSAVGKTYVNKISTRMKTAATELTAEKWKTIRVERKLSLDNAREPGGGEGGEKTLETVGASS